MKRVRFPSRQAHAVWPGKADNDFFVVSLPFLDSDFQLASILWHVQGTGIKQVDTWGPASNIARSQHIVNLLAKTFFWDATNDTIVPLDDREWRGQLFSGVKCLERADEHGAIRQLTAAAKNENEMEISTCRGFHRTHLATVHAFFGEGKILPHPRGYACELGLDSLRGRKHYTWVDGRFVNAHVLACGNSVMAVADGTIRQLPPATPAHNVGLKLFPVIGHFSADNVLTVNEEFVVGGYDHLWTASIRTGAVTQWDVSVGESHSPFKAAISNDGCTAAVVDGVGLTILDLT